MTTYRLTYFDVDGGRAEHIRIAFHAAGIAFDDKRISFQEFGETRSGFRFTCVPVMEIDGEQVTQGNALGRYIGKMAGLYPSDPLQALYCDEVLGAIEDLTNHIGRTMRMTGDEQRAAREELANGWISVYLKGLVELLARGGGEYFADKQLTIADLRAMVQTHWLTSGALDHIPGDLVQRIAPALVEHQARVAADPRVVAYYAARNA
jgi:glutathione S-transferase